MEWAPQAEFQDSVGPSLLDQRSSVLPVPCFRTLGLMAVKSMIYFAVLVEADKDQPIKAHRKPQTRCRSCDSVKAKDLHPLAFL